VLGGIVPPESENVSGFGAVSKVGAPSSSQAEGSEKREEMKFRGENEKKKKRKRT
jgi:hypothetical protein